MSKPSAEAGAPAGPADNGGNKADVELNTAKLAAAVASDQGEVFILQWLAKADAALQRLSQDDLLDVQPRLERTLLRLVCPLDLDAATEGPQSSTSPAVPPATRGTEQSGVPRLGRPARHLIARCLVTVFARGETRTLYDVMQALMRIAGEETKGRPIPEKESKAGALYIAGELFLAVGHNVMSQFVGVMTLCQRIAKITNNPVILRYHALLCLAKVLRNAGRSLAEQSFKDLKWTLRSAIGDRAGAVSRAGAECLRALLQQTTFLSTLGEIDSLLTIAIKALDVADFTTKRALSQLCADLLVFTQKENTVLRPPRPRRKKSSKKEDKNASSEDEAGPSTPSTASAAGGRGTMLTAKSMLDRLGGPMQRASTCKKGRGALLDVYATLLEQLGPNWVQSNYDTVLRHFMDEIPNNVASSWTRADALSVRRGIALILRDVIGERMLDETAQVGAIEEISTLFLKRWPVLMPGHQPPSKLSLVMAFNEMTGLLEQLGSAPPQVVDALQDPVLRCLAHPSHSVQVSAAWCFRTLCLVCPPLLSQSIESVFANLRRDMASLHSSGERSGAELPKRAIGHARGLAALVSVIPQRPLYISFDISGKVLDLALQLLKGSAEHTLAISAVEIQIAWILLGALMSLGPEFVKDHIVQLLNMWRSALPKVSDAPSARSDAEWSFLLHVRECTLGCVLAFLTFNSTPLVTLDAARRIIALLSNTLSFVNTFAAQHPTLFQEQTADADRGSLTLLDREQMVRRRVFQCFTHLANSPALEVMQEALVNFCIQMFAEPDRYIGSTAQAAIAASAGSFTSIWHLTDGYACGATSMLSDTGSSVASDENLAAHAQQNLLNRDAVEAKLDALQRKPILGALEFDPLILYLADASDVLHLPVAPPTAVVDASITVFCKLLPFQRREIQISAFETLVTCSRSSRLDKNPGRRMAVQANACSAALGTLRTAMQPSSGRQVGGFNNERLTGALRAILLDALTQGDQALRTAASEAFGRLAAISGSQTMASQVQTLVDQVVSNRNPDVRAGCAFAFGSIYHEVGGLATGPLTKTVVDILISLANDPHPMVHFSALEGLRLVVDAASLSYSSYVQSTLGMLVKLYMMSTHEPEGGSAGSVNLRADLPADQAICRVINALIGVVGPDLNEPTKIRNLILVLIGEFSKENDDGVVVEATQATQHFALFAAQHIDLVAWMLALQTRLKSNKRPLKLAAINSFYQLIQRNALLVSKTCGNALVEDFFALLDGDADTEEVKQVLRSWLRQTADLSPTSWIELCQRVSSGISASRTAATTTQDAKKGAPPGALHDEEAAAIDLGDDTGGRSYSKQSRWRTQLFALQCLHEVLATVYKAGKLQHFDTPGQHSQLSSRVGDLIKMAFTASTSVNLDIRLEGLTILHDVIDYFKLARDPDFDDALLLEQHQAPIAAALTPAFLSDSMPEVLAKAVQVCAVFVGCGVVREVDKLGRILKLLTRALKSSLEPSMKKLGDVDHLSSNAAAILKIAVYDAWAQLQVASMEQAYIVQVVAPHVAQLATMWINTLAEYAQLRADPDGTGMAMGPAPSPVLESQYAGLVRGVLLPHHQRTWPVILNAVAALMSQSNKEIACAMDGDGSAKTDPSPYRSEPALYFYPLYGLSFEALATASGSLREEEIIKKTLFALRHLCKPEYAGGVLLRDELFDELMNLCYRIIMTESAPVQIATVDLAASLASSYKARLIDQENGSAMVEGPSNLLVPPSKMTTCLRLVLFAVQFARSKTAATASRSDQRARLIRASYTALLSIAAHYTKTQQEHLYIAGLYSYSELLGDETSDADLVGPTLASLKDLCLACMDVYGDALARTIQGFLSACLNTLDSVRSRSGAVAFNKSKNALLSIIVVITSLSPDAILSQTILENYCYELATRLRNPNGESGLQIALTSTNCVKTMLLAASRASAEGDSRAMAPALGFCVGQTLSHLVSVLFASRNIKLLAAHDNKVRVTEEVLKTVTGFASVAQDEDHRARLIGVVLPALALFLPGDTATKDDSEAVTTAASRLRTTAINQILALARQYSAAFRTVVGLLDADTRTLVETSVKKAVGLGAVGDASARQDAAAAAARGEAKTIELRSFG